jgi:hypothetical protein
MRNNRVLQLPQNMQICFDDYEEEEEEERSDIIFEDEERKNHDDDDVDRILNDTDEKLNNTAEEYFRGEYKKIPPSRLQQSLES